MQGGPARADAKQRSSRNRAAISWYFRPQYCEQVLLRRRGIAAARHATARSRGAIGKRKALVLLPPERQGRRNARALSRADGLFALWRRAFSPF